MPKGRAQQMARIQYAMWVDDGAACAWCEKPYSSVDDFIARNPRVGLGFRKGGNLTDHLVDEVCFPEHEAWNQEHV